MKRKIRICFGIAIILLVTGCGSTQENLAEDVATKDAHSILNSNVLYDAILEDAVDPKSFEAISVEYECGIFPPELIESAERILYRACEKQKGNLTESTIYFDWLEDRGGEDYKLTMDEMCTMFPEVAKQRESFYDVYDAYEFMVNEHCGAMFYYETAEKEGQFLLCCESGGSYGLWSIMRAEYQNGEFVVQDEFETQNNGFGVVIKHEEEFYYIFLQYNYNLKNYDSIRIHKLGDNAATENILIRYIPNKYEWKLVEDIIDAPDDASADRDTQLEGYRYEVDQYLASIRQELMSGKYLEQGDVDDGLKCFAGDEQVASDFPLTEKYKTYYQVDMANVGEPVYFEKNIFMPSNTYTSVHYRTPFYLYNPDTKEVKELEALRINEQIPNKENQLVQLWFKKIDDKIFTFTIFHLSDYDYMLKVSLIEGDAVTEIREVMLLPIRKMELQEGQEYGYF